MGPGLGGQSLGEKLPDEDQEAGSMVALGAEVEEGRQRER